MWLNLNINDTVRIKITQAGFKFLERQHKDLNSKYNTNTPYKAPNVDKDGHTEMPLWEVMQLFGDQMYNGNPDIPYETSIALKVNEAELKLKLEEYEYHVPKEPTAMYIRMDDRDFDALVNDNISSFNREYECIPYNEWNNYSTYTFDDISDKTDNRFTREYDYPKIESGDMQSVGARAILEYLCERGVISPGNYMITCSW